MRRIVAERGGRGGRFASDEVIAEEEGGDHGEHQPAGLHPELADREPAGAVIAAGDEPGRDGPAVIAAVRRAVQIHGGVVEEGVEADGVPDAAAADDGKGHGRGGGREGGGDGQGSRAFSGNRAWPRRSPGWRSPPATGRWIRPG